MLAEDANTAVRREFFFEQAPSVTLCMALLELCALPRRCGLACLYLCDRLSTSLTLDVPQLDERFVLATIRRLAAHAKLMFFNAGDTNRWLPGTGLLLTLPESSRPRRIWPARTCCGFCKSMATDRCQHWQTCLLWIGPAAYVMR